MTRLSLDSVTNRLSEFYDTCELCSFIDLVEGVGEDVDSAMRFLYDGTLRDWDSGSLNSSYFKRYFDVGMYFSCYCYHMAV